MCISLWLGRAVQARGFRRRSKLNPKSPRPPLPGPPGHDPHPGPRAPASNGITNGVNGPSSKPSYSFHVGPDNQLQPVSFPHLEQKRCLERHNSRISIKSRSSSATVRKEKKPEMMKFLAGSRRKVRWTSCRCG